MTTRHISYNGDLVSTGKGQEAMLDAYMHLENAASEQEEGTEERREIEQAMTILAEFMHRDA